MRINAFLFISALLLSTTVYAGGHTGGGDGAIVDDQVVLADPFLVREHAPITEDGVLFTPHPEIIAEMKLATRLLEHYGGFILDETFFDPKVQYYYVTQFKDPRCDNQAPYQFPDGSTFLGTFACTDGNQTWVLEKNFRQMSVREQAKLLIHERLRGLSFMPALNLIADFTDGVETVLTLYRSQMGGARPKLSESEIAKINYMRNAIRMLQLGYPDIRGNPIYPNGGAAVNSAVPVGAGAYLGIGIELRNPKSVIGDHVTMIDIHDRVDALGGEKLIEYHLAAAAQILHSVFDVASVTLGEDSSIRNATVRGEGVAIETTDLCGHHMWHRPLLPKRFNPDVVEVSVPGAVLQLGSGASISNSEIRAGSVYLYDRASMRNATVLGGESEIDLREGAIIADFTIGDDASQSFSPTLYLGPGAALRNGRILPDPDLNFLRAYGRGYRTEDGTSVCSTTLVDTIAIDDGVKIDLGEQQFCPAALKGNRLRRGSITVRSLADLVARCAR